ncbi:hypothetical protein AYY16_05955 [Morganella psychrotolerans]|nr:hypothetical protein [Morganella psychrotolerans]OBU08786.1 hypothetical protein AYY16_05955 [Morganella psychrotolerans]
MKQNSAEELSLISRNIEIKNSNIKSKNINLKTIRSSYGDGYKHASSINIDNKSIIIANEIRVDAYNGTIINNGHLTGNAYSSLNNISLKNNGHVNGKFAQTYLFGDIYIQGSKSINFEKHEVIDGNKNNIFWSGGKTVIN